MTAPAHTRVALDDGLVTVYHAKTGVAIRRHPVDARLSLQTHEYLVAPLGEVVTDLPVWARGIPTSGSRNGNETGHAEVRHVDAGPDGGAEASQDAHAARQSKPDEDHAGREVVRNEIKTVNGVAMTPLGERANVTRAHEASPTHPYQAPPTVGYTKSGQPDKRYKRP